MKKFIYILVFITLLLPYHVFSFNIKSEHAILYNLNDNTVLYELKSNDRVSIASMTKIMTALIVIDNIDNLNEEFTMTADMYKSLKEENAALAGFSIGERVTYYDLLYGLLLPSGAEAAQGLAIKTSGSIDNFVIQMNDKVKELNLSNTHFANPTGLDNENNYSSVYDVAVILKKALENKEFKKIFTTKKYVTSNKRHTFLSTSYRNDIDTSFIDGSKTGFTYDAGLCMASISHYNGVNYLLVTAKAPYDNRSNHIIDAKTIYNYYFTNYGEQVILNKNDRLVTINLYDERSIDYLSNVDVKKYLKKDCTLVKEYRGKDIIKETDELNSKLGEFVIKCDDDIIYQQDILVVQKAGPTDKMNFKEYIVVIMIIMVISFTLILLFRKRYKNVHTK